MPRKDEPMLTYVLRRLDQAKGHHPRISAETGVSGSTIAKITQKVIRDPRISKIQKLHDYFRKNRFKKAS